MAGTLKHSYAAKLIDRYQRLYGAVGEGLTTEQSYAAGEYLGRAQNIKGSVRLDVVEHVVENPTAIFDFKFTINPNPILSPARVLQIRRAAALAEDVPLETVHP